MKITSSTRRQFLTFLGYGTVSFSSTSLLTSCSSILTTSKNDLIPTFKDDVVLRDGLNYDILISWGDKINDKEVFGFNNDYINIEALTKDKLIMWVNHEYINPVFVSSIERTKRNVDIEKTLVGGSLIEINKINGRWKFNPQSQYNRGVRGNTKIPFANGIKIKGSSIAEGTLGNCAGGKTPWGTFLTCEENYDGFYGERNRKTGELITKKSRYDWFKFYPQNVPEHYGWVVEVEPKTGQAKKHTNLGRIAHECATPIISKSKKVVVYTGDDTEDEHLYKFISKSDSDFNEGILYVASLEQRKWLPLDLKLSPELKKHFSKQIDVLTYAREAAKILGATPLNRPEDIEINPLTGDVFIALTNNKKRNDFHGSILKISEDNNDHASLTFKAEVFRFGGEQAGFTCPDNMAFDKRGNLWITNDVSGSSIGNKTYKQFGNNGIFVIPAYGAQAGRTIQVASAPKEAEFTGLCFDPDQKTLFVSVQHPGELTKDINHPTSTWPTGKSPKPSVIAISGPYLDALIRG